MVAVSQSDRVHDVVLEVVVMVLLGRLAELGLGIVLLRSLPHETLWMLMIPFLVQWANQFEC